MPEKDRRSWRRIPGLSWDKLWQIPALFDIKLLSVLAAITGVDCVHLKCFLLTVNKHYSRPWLGATVTGVGCLHYLAES